MFNKERDRLPESVEIMLEQQMKQERPCSKDLAKRKHGC